MRCCFGCWIDVGQDPTYDSRMAPECGQWRCRICAYDRYHLVTVTRKNGQKYETSFYACSKCSVMFLNPAQWSAFSSAPVNIEAPPSVVTSMRRRR